ncbi:Putative peptidoglycan binding domain-containing protein [Nannocystis exedens]|uniref:Putative peptidoglycan binding domain-containing protein n=1 Tax=Nannocystis exedens TaxID=54 RepID=A0A1I2FG06_9BACT|nr:peptidoglycan-binding domain-containing protein [Nannocystis exedens]PCC70488.1 putative peptidoglycan binding domain protein [Nannocystis exedens]SFF03456.1 Putative peptidoglycan binding domain-containing protein [Nannocystis exedens]
MGHVHTVEPGECLLSVADRFGFFPDTLWNAPENAELRRTRARATPLVPGDAVFIPSPREKQADAPTDARSVFKRRGVPAQIHVRLLRDGQPCAGVAYTLAIGGLELKGVTSPSGQIEHWIATTVRTGRLTLATGEVYELAVGRLEPASEERGVRARLCSLGFLAAIDAPPAELAAALRQFQAAARLPVTGAVDDATRARLVARHGS